MEGAFSSGGDCSTVVNFFHPEAVAMKVEKIETESTGMGKIDNFSDFIEAQTQDIKVEEFDSLAEGEAFSAQKIYFSANTNHLVNTNVLHKEEDLEVDIEEEEEESAQVDFHFCALSKNQDESHTNKELSAAMASEEADFHSQVDVIPEENNFTTKPNVKPVSFLKKLGTKGTKFKAKGDLRKDSATHQNKTSFSGKHHSSTCKRKGKRHCISHSDQRLLSCRQHCTATSMTKKGLKRHLITHSDVRKFCCEHCSSTFKTKMCLKKHLSVHSYARPFSCSYCPSTFKTKNDLKKHTLVHSNVKGYSCAHCFSLFKAKSSLKTHFSVNSNLGPITCSHCSAVFESKCALKEHLEMYSKIWGLGRVFFCPYCIAISWTQKDFEEHLAAHPNGNISGISSENQEDSHCYNKELKTAIKSGQIHEDDLSSHSNSKPFSSSDSAVTCHPSGQTDVFNYEDSRSNIEIEPFSFSKNVITYPGPGTLKTCSKRNALLPNTSNMSITSENKEGSHCNNEEIHLAITSGHTDKIDDDELGSRPKLKPFSFSDFTTTSSTKGDIKKHLATNLNARPSYCMLCAANCISKNHSIFHSAVNFKHKFSCPNCIASFKTHSELKSHLVSHSIFKPFSCKHCHARFKRKAGLKLHSVIHSDVKPYFCAFCSANFKRKSYLRKHCFIHERLLVP